MELIFKAAAVALVSAAVGLLIKRTNPEMSLAVGACTVAMIALAAMSFAGELKSFIKTVKTIAGTSDVLIAPVLKCVAIAAAVELAGTVCAMSVAMPLIVSVLRMIGGMV